MGLAGIPWWTTDIGGFHGGDPKDPKFQELLVRWFEYGTFCPVMRLHGYREPLKEPMGKEGGAACVSGADNEVWSFGEEAYEICKKYLALRESMKPYITELMEAAHEKGTPVMRPLFYDFPKDSKCWETEGGAGLCAGRTECEKRGCAAEVFCKISKKNHKGKTGCHRCSAGEDQ